MIATTTAQTPDPLIEQSDIGRDVDVPGIPRVVPKVPRLVTPQPPSPKINRPRGLGRAARPADIPVPAHSHLPGWARRAHAQARPILADLIGQLDGDERERFAADVNDLIAGMSSGKFSLAWQFPRLINEGNTALEGQRKLTSEVTRQRRALDAVRRRATDRLREGSSRVAPDVVARLDRALRVATDAEQVGAVDAEITQALGAARSVDDRRRDREIDRTRARIMKAAPRSTGPSAPTESWQDALRRIADEADA